ncbi:MAG: hypothetical protein EPN93_16455 [Spirochaetes bacterium]|nr:MAG: hypothetical protein EPN93_16455 [Spirochaetota bacterium]
MNREKLSGGARKGRTAIIIPFVCALVLLVPRISFAAQEKAEEELFFTYVGPVLEAGLASVSYDKWNHTNAVLDSRTAAGPYFSGGVQLDIFVHDFVGEFALQVRDSMFDKAEVAAIYVRTAAFGKYLYAFNESFFATGGFGILMDTGPASKTYDGGGGIAAAIGAGYSFARDWRIMFDITANFGRYGIGEEAKTTAYGVKLAVMYKIGRL